MIHLLYSCSQRMDILSDISVRADRSEALALHVRQVRCHDPPGAASGPDLKDSRPGFPYGCRRLKEAIDDWEALAVAVHIAERLCERQSEGLLQAVPLSHGHILEKLLSFAIDLHPALLRGKALKFCIHTAFLLRLPRIDWYAAECRTSGRDKTGSP